MKQYRSIAYKMNENRSEIILPKDIHIKNFESHCHKV